MLCCNNRISFALFSAATLKDFSLVLHGTKTSPYDQTNHPLLAGKSEGTNNEGNGDGNLNEQTTSVSPQSANAGTSFFDTGESELVPDTTNPFYPPPPAVGGRLAFPPPSDQDSSSHAITPHKVLMLLPFYASQLTHIIYDWAIGAGFVKVLSIFLAATLKFFF